jgi:GTP-binding protein HflX
MKQGQRTVYREKAVLVGVIHGDEESPLDELASLVETAGAVPVAEVIQNRERPDPKYYVGSGKVTEIAELVAHHKADVVIFDNELSPGQVRSLEKEIGKRTIDRTELILDIFATHARSNQSKLQVELAQLQYALPRVRALATHITSEQQAGGVGVGQRGPGEKQLEFDRRLIRKQITDLKREIVEIEKRKKREVTARNVDNYTVALVGYTNAGKSTLMNALTSAGVLAEDKLFSTLDTRTRLWRLKGGTKVLLSDTVGFIRNLPHALVASFHATLEEVLQADLLLHVVDASHPQAAEQIAAVEAVLKQLGATDREMVMALNKVDAVTDAIELSILQNRVQGSLCVSAATGVGLDVLEARVAESVATRMRVMEVRIPFREGKLLAEIASHSVVLEQTFEEEHARMKLRVPRWAVWKLKEYETAPQA